MGKLERKLKTKTGLRVHGNKEIVEMFKMWTAMAEKGELYWGAVVACQPGDQVGYSWAGNWSGLSEGSKGLAILKAEVDERLAGRVTHDNSQTIQDASFHEFNLGTDPMNFDSLIWMVDAEMIRQRAGAPWPLRVGFKNEHLLDPHGKRWFAAVHKPLLNLLGAVEDPRAIGGMRAAAFTPNQICMAARRGEEVPILQANLEAKSWAPNYVAQWHPGKAPVVITLREGTHWGKNSAVNRNSNVAAWVKFARDLQKKGELVIFVRDTEKANEPLEDFPTCPQASFSIQPRMALCEIAKCNLYVANGPAGLGLFSRRPYLYFQPLREDRYYEPLNPQWWIRSNGIGEGDEWPWAKPGQHMIWREDDYRNICEAWERHSHEFDSGASVCADDPGRQSERDLAPAVGTGAPI